MEKIFWLLAIGVTCLNAYMLYSRAQTEIARNPELAEGYWQLIKGYLVWFNLPWVVMGLGIVLGRTHGAFEYFNPRVGNPYVIAFHVTILVQSMLAIFWIYFAGGAEFLVAHPGVLNVDVKSPLVMKLLFGLGLLGGLVGEIVMWSGRLHLQNPG